MERCHRSPHLPVRQRGRCQAEETSIRTGNNHVPRHTRKPATASFHLVSTFRLLLRIWFPFSTVNAQASGLLPTREAHVVSPGASWVNR